MAIISVNFILFALVVCLMYFLLPMRTRPYWLLVCSIVFYACFDVKYFMYIGFTVLTTFAAAHLASLAGSKGMPKLKKAIMLTAVFLNAGLLFVVKFLGYSVSLVGMLFDVPVPEISIPAALGIAFYTMQAISYCVDVYRGKYPPEKNLFKYLLYMTYFPIIMQGPISRFDQLADQLFTPHRFSFHRMKSGLSLILWGMFQKMVIADRAAILVNQVFGNYADYAGLQIVIGMILYSIQLYTDFSGFTDISRGLSEILGIRLIRNFDAPYLADSIKDFWRRWHISLSSWFRDYIYIPLGGNRKGTLCKYANLLTVFFVSGLWHGVGVNYIVWGLMQGVFQIVGELTHPFKNRLYEKAGVDQTTFSFRFGKWLVTFALANVSWLLFRANGLRAGLKMLKSALTVWNPWILTDGTLFNMGLDGKEWNVLLLSVAILFGVNIMQQKGSVREKLEQQMFWFRYMIYIGAVLAILIFGIYGPGFDVAQFLYMQF